MSGRPETSSRDASMFDGTSIVANEIPAVFRAPIFGTTVELLLTDNRCLEVASDTLMAELNRVDKIANRFRADSELSALNACNGKPYRASEGFLDAVRMAIRAASLTQGSVDPTVGSALFNLGYNRTFKEVPKDQPGRPPAPSPVPGWEMIEIDEKSLTVKLPRGVKIDLGSTAKAAAADAAAEAVLKSTGSGVLVSIGGDIATAGTPPSGGWAVGLADISGIADVQVVVSIVGGGLATSGVSARQWQLGGKQMHHVIDPATGLPADRHWRTVTVAATSCLDANIASTACIVKGASGATWLEQLKLPARLVSAEGQVVRVAGWPEDSSG